MKQYILNRRGEEPKLEQVPTEKIPVYSDYDSAEADLNNLNVGDIVATSDTQIQNDEFYNLVKRFEALEADYKKRQEKATFGAWYGQATTTYTLEHFSEYSHMIISGNNAYNTAPSRSSNLYIGTSSLHFDLNDFREWAIANNYDSRLWAGYGSNTYNVDRLFITGTTWDRDNDTFTFTLPANCRAEFYKW